MAGDPFTSAIFRWLNTVNSDVELPAGAFKLAYAISQHVNRSSCQAWPSHETLVCAAGFRPGENATRNVRRLLKALVDRGHLLTTRRRQTSLIYRLAQDRTELSYQEVQTGDENETRPDNIDLSKNQDRTFFASRPDNFCHQDRTDLSYKPLIEPLKNHEGESRGREGFLPDGFKLDDRTLGWALNRLGSHDAVTRSVDRFVNHHRQVTGKTAKSRDWQAKVRNWIDDDARKSVPDKSVHSAAKRLHETMIAFDRGVTADSEWDAVLSSYVKFGRWTKHIDQFGPAPNERGCIAPERLLLKHGIAKREDAA